MDKIVIIGSPGAGKSTFARTLGQVLDIEVFHLDRYFWKPDWKEYPRDKRILIQHQLVEGKKRWIIEGTYLSSSDKRLAAADTIIFLDIPPHLCLLHVVKRRFQDAKKPRPDLPIGCKERLSPPYILKVLVFPYRGKRTLLDRLEAIRKKKVNTPEQPKKEILICKSQKESASLLQKLYNEQGGQQQVAVGACVASTFAKIG